MQLVKTLLCFKETLKIILLFQEINLILECQLVINNKLARNLFTLIINKVSIKNKKETLCIIFLIVKVKFHLMFLLKVEK